MMNAETKSTNLTALQQAVEHYELHGYAILRNHLSQETVEKIKHQISQLESKVVCVPSPFKSQKVGSAKHLVESAHQVVGFSSGPKKPIQQIGHNLHGMVGDIASLCYSDKVWSICKALSIDDPRIVQSKVVLKPANHGWRVPAHTDEQFIFTRPLSGAGLWWAVDRCSKGNGCLEVIPGSHKEFKMESRFVCDHVMLCTKFSLIPPLENETRVTWTKKCAQRYKSRFKVLEMEPGDLVWCGCGLCACARQCHFVGFVVGHSPPFCHPYECCQSLQISSQSSYHTHR